jgi:hypothetical protein
MKAMDGTMSIRPDWLATTRRYLIAVTLGNLVWETAQMPLYTLWHTATARQMAQAILHCTLGDTIIASVGLIAALVLVGSANWPDRRAGAVIVAVTIGSAVYTIYSEYMNTVVHQSWVYAASMPRLPWLGTGLSPFAQWLIIPGGALAWAARIRPSAK